MSIKVKGIIALDSMVVEPEGGREGGEQGVGGDREGEGRGLVTTQTQF